MRATLIGEMVDRLDHGPLGGSCGGHMDQATVTSCTTSSRVFAELAGKRVGASGRLSRHRGCRFQPGAPARPGEQPPVRPPRPRLGQDGRAGRPPRLDRVRTTAASTGGNYGCLAVSVSGIIIGAEGRQGDSRPRTGRGSATHAEIRRKGSTRRPFAVSADLLRGCARGVGSARRRTRTPWIPGASRIRLRSASTHVAEDRGRKVLFEGSIRTASACSPARPHAWSRLAGGG